MLIDYFASTINSYLPEPHASLLNGITFGIPLHTSKQFYEQLKITGLLHVVVLSGSNVAFMTALLIQTTSVLSKRISLLITILGLIIFLLLVSFQAPILRATFMGVLTIVAELYGRRTQSLYILFISALILIIARPDLLTSISFQLSYGATLGIILFSKPQTEKSGLKYYILTTVKTTFAAQIFVIPILAFYFHQISLISLFSNVLILWIIEPLLLLGLIIGFIGSFFAPIAVVGSIFAYGLLSYFITLVQILSQIPYSSISF